LLHTDAELGWMQALTDLWRRMDELSATPKSQQTLG
jgi:hypothetical protein